MRQIKTVSVLLTWPKASDLKALLPAVVVDEEERAGLRHQPVGPGDGEAAEAA